MREKTYVGLIDLRQAFDRVDREVLLKIMDESTLPRETVAAVAKIMNATSFSVPIDSEEKVSRPGQNYKIIKTDIGVQ